MPSGTTRLTVVDRDGRLIEAVDRYLEYLVATNSSANTIKSYARHLALFFRWLDERTASWEELTFDGLCAFGMDLQDGTLQTYFRRGVPRPQAPRSRATCESVMAAVYSFLDYWRLEGRGPQDLRLYREASSRRRSTHNFLAHVEHLRTQQERRLRFRGPKADVPKVIAFEEDFERLVAAARTHRDRALISAMYDGGLRIGQAIGLRHEDVDIARKRVRVVRRENNANGALSKQRHEFVVDVPPRFITYYGLSLTDEQLALDIHSDYVFVNLSPAHRGAPMKYENAKQIIAGIGTRAGLTLTPHTLRHTHGTALAKQGWSAPEIAARLGHSSNSSADVYIHLAEDDLADKYAETSMARREA